jgi:hypothetical protein
VATDAEVLRSVRKVNRREAEPARQFRSSESRL